MKFKKQLLRLLAAGLTFGGAMLVLLYFLGYYDLSFLDRYKVLGEIFDDAPANQTQNGPSAFFDPSDLLTEEDLLSGDAQTEETAPSEDGMQTAETPSSDGASGASGASDVIPSYETASVKSVFDADRLADRLLTTAENGGSTVADLRKMGYHRSGISYSEAGLSFVPPETEVPETAETEDTETKTTEVNEADLVPKVVTGEYVPGKTVLGKLTFSFQLPDTFSLRTREMTRKIINIPADDGEYYLTTKPGKEKRPAVDLYMGYILIDDGENLSVIASDATPLCGIDENVYFPAYARDQYDRPLFYRSSADGETVYFYLDPKGQNFISTAYDEVAEGRGLRFDYPASYGKSDSSISTDRNGVTGRMAYVNKGVGMVTGYDFTQAFAFREGLAAVTATKNRGGMYFIDENGKQAFETWYYYFNEHGRDGYANLVQPLTDGIENIGFYYFDHGLTRVRTQTIDAYNWVYVRRIRLMRDEHILIRADGSEYELPAGYELEGYSEGMILLSKNGRYGFIDYTGEWIAQPIYTDATPFICGLATLTTEDGRVGMIDTEGNIVLQFTYDYISQVSDGLIAAYRAENGWTVLKMMEKDA